MEGRRAVSKTSDAQDLKENVAVSLADTGTGDASFEEKALKEHKERQAGGSPSGDPVEGLPKGKIGDVEISRVICGSNLFWGAAHSGELRYVSRLLRHYFTPGKIMETLRICEENGIDTNIGSAAVLKKYREETGGSMQSIPQVDPDNHRFNPDGSVTTTVDDIRKTIDESAENGAVGILIVGLRADRYVKANRVDLLDEFVTYGKSCGLITGVGAHDVRVPVACEREGVDVDFYFKTIHHGNYDRALPKEKREPFLVDSFGPGDHDCIWEQYPDETIKLMRDIKKPWIGFKVLAAGAIPPADGFRFAFENGADFICVGMFDWQVADDVRIAKEVFSSDGVSNRSRPWA